MLLAWVITVSIGLVCLWIARAATHEEPAHKDNVVSITRVRKAESRYLD